MMDSDTATQLHEQNIQIQYNIRKTNPKLAWLNAIAIVGIGGIGYFTTAKGDSDYNVKGICWLIGLWLVNIMSLFSFVIAIMGLFVYIFMYIDTYYLMKRVEVRNAALLENIRKEEYDGTEYDIVEETPVENSTEKNAPVEQSTTGNAISEEDFKKYVANMNEQRVLNGFEPLPATSYDYIKYTGKQD